MSKKLYVFTAKWCTSCAPLKVYLKNIGIEFEEIDVETDEGSKQATQYNVKALPTSLITGSEGETLLLLSGTGAIDMIRKELDK